MELHFDLAESLKNSPVQRLDATALKWMTPQRDAGVRTAIDKMGVLSAEAQGLKRPLTTFEKLLSADDAPCVYLMWKKKDSDPSLSVVYGFLKTCRRTLYLVDGAGKCSVDYSPLCVMDFFVHPSVQKQGYAVVLFNHMLEAEHISADKCAYDKPSEALLKFLSHHYGLTDPIWQSTNFVVFPGFFESSLDKSDSANIPVVKRPSITVSSHQQQQQRESIPRNRRDTAGDIIHGDLPLPAKVLAAPDTPQGRKYTRDFGHQPIW